MSPAKLPSLAPGADANDRAKLPDSAPARNAPPTDGFAPPRARFSWIARDVAHSGMIAFHLGMLRHVEHGEAIMESAAEMLHRPPRLTDAWRYFHAASQLANANLIALAAPARAIGARIALAVSGLTVVDMVLVECGATSGLGLYVERRDTPLVLEFKDAAGNTVLDQADGAR